MKVTLLLALLGTASPGNAGEHAAPSIRVRVADKMDEVVEKDLEADMAGCKKAKPRVEFREVLTSLVVIPTR